MLASKRLRDPGQDDIYLVLGDDGILTYNYVDNHHQSQHASMCNSDIVSMVNGGQKGDF